MKSHVAFRAPNDGDKGPTVSILTRVDDICLMILERLKDEEPKTRMDTLATVFLIYIQGATYIECMTNVLLRESIATALANAKPNADFSFFSAVERLSTERKIELLSELKVKPKDFTEKMKIIKHLLERRNFLVHFKANPDVHSVESLLDVGVEFPIPFNDEKALFTWINLLPDQKWVSELHACDRVGVIDSFCEIGNWLEQSFGIGNGYRDNSSGSHQRLRY